jgi:hypothetical protein
MYCFGEMNLDLWKKARKSNEEGVCQRKDVAVPSTRPM